MKKQTNLLISTFLTCVFSLFVLFTATPVHATVGGETLLHSFTYNPANESVYYIKQSFSGRGCPPELMKLSLVSEKVDTVYSCDDGEKVVIGNGGQFSPASYSIHKITENFKPLTPLSLKDNGIAIDVTFTRAENYSPEINEVVRRHFTASVYQNTKKVAEFPIIGCNITQPFLFQGYALPGFDKKIALLLSTKGDCFEGGYTNETLHIVGGVDNLNKTVMTNFYKNASALIPNEGNLLVYEADKVNLATNTVPTDKDSGGNLVVTATVFLIALLLGLALGKVVYTK